MGQFINGEERDAANNFVGGGNNYALEITQRLGLEDSGRMVRVGPAHDNTLEAIKRFGEASGRMVQT